MNHLSKSVSIVLALISLSACESVDLESKLTSADSQSTSSADPVEGPFKSFGIALSEQKESVTDYGVGFGLNLGPVLTADQSSHFDELKREGILRFSIDYWDTYLPSQGGSRNLWTCRDTSYLFTRVNDNHYRWPDYDHEAAIYYKNRGVEIKVGRYLPPRDQSTDSEIYDRYLHPMLCEGEFASICRVNLLYRIEAGEGLDDFDHAVEVHLELLDGSNQGNTRIGKNIRSRVYDFDRIFGCN